ncbi:organic cation transporter protein [Drosophila guanche]|uniref:Blast:Organic cation transporter protein n=1 Tax=Drosophila guanche TaxID=7266 RepID=A0A3B0KHV4_DROGU|nr:organic cation transporter protein [Drosophila guanche]SPP88040.1 blast:Organic cation transporter protein [Drosophila guanche]
MNFEEILAKCGNSSRYQFLLLSLYGFLMVVISMHYFSQNVISFVPDHWCYHEQLESRSYAEIEAIYAQFERPSCTLLASIDEDGGNATASPERCNRWIYKYDFGYKSMNTELNWVCDEAYKPRVGQSLFFVGSVCGTLVFGLLGDRIGRIKALILANWCGFLGDFSTIFAASLTSFSVSRFVSGLAADANSYLMYILILEYVSPSLRNIGLNTVLGSFYCLGLIGASWLAVWVGHWRIFLACSSLPLLLVTLFYFLVQESAQWLVTRNDIDGAITRLQRVAKINRREVSDDDFKAFRGYCERHYEKEVQAADNRQTKLLDMLKTPRMRSTAFKLLTIFIIITPCYNTIARNVEGLGISPFVMFSLNALTLPPSGYLQGLLQDRIGRKATAVSWMAITGLFAAGAGLVMSQGSSQQNVLLLVALTLAARFGVSIADGASAQFSTELIPTCVRGRGVAVVHVAGFAASFLSPYILHLGTYFRPAPSIILGLLFLAGAYVCLLLPETRNRKLPVFLAEGEEFGKGERMFDFLRHLRQGGGKDKAEGAGISGKEKEEDTLMTKVA